MISKVTKKGRSFKGAALYYLHDKGGAITDDRVAFTHTLNLATDDPHIAARMMAYTAMHQSEIKRRAGGEAKGRKLTLPVYVYSLSWKPTEAPTREEMIEAANQSLKTLGLTSHEIIMAAHNDEPHPHIHVIVNRVHPETGIAAPVSNDHLRLSEWAEEYERQHGEIFCHRRVENNERRRNGEWVKDLVSQNAAEYHRWRSAQARLRAIRRDQQFKNLSAAHRREQESLAKATEQRTTQQRAKLREQNRPAWATLYKRQEHHQQQFTEAQRTAWGRVRYYLKHRDPWDGSGNRTPLRGIIAGAFQAVVSNTAAASTFAQKQKRERITMANRVNHQAREALKKINAAHDRQRDQLTVLQRAEQAATKKALTLQSKKHARDLASGKTRADFDKLAKHYQPLRDQLQKASDPKADRKAKTDEKRRKTYRAFRDQADETTLDTRTEQKKEAATAKRRALKAKMDRTKEDITRDTKSDQKAKTDEKRQKTYRAFRDLADETTKKKDKGRAKRDDSTDKTDYRAFRDQKEDKDKGRDTDQGRKRSRKNPPKSPKNGV